MNDSFTWPVGREERGQAGVGQNSAALPVWAYFGTCTIAGAMMGGVLAALGASRALLGTAQATVVVALVALALLAIVLEVLGRVSPLPERRLQVPTGWLSWRPRWKTAAAFGLMLGAGFFTHLRHATVYALVAVIMLSGSVAVGVALGCVYGASRGAVLVLTWAGDRWLGRRLRWGTISQARRQVSLTLALTSLLALAVALAATDAVRGVVFRWM